MRLSATKNGAISTGRGLGNELWDKAGTAPSLDLQFADNKSLADATTGSNLVTFTRASRGTFVDSAGVLQTAVTNLLLRSEEFYTSWARFGTTTLNTNTVTAPNGTLTADNIVFTSASAGIYQAVAGLASITYTFSIWIKSSSSTQVRIVINTNLGDPVIQTVTVTSAWQRFNISKTTSAGTNSVTAQVQDNGSGGTQFDLWGAQLEQSATVGEYIPTTSTINSAPRFDHNPTTGESLGLLVEEQRTNFATQSESFSTWNVSGQGTTQSTDVGIVAPDGSTGNVQLFTENLTTSNHRIYIGQSTGQTVHTHSVFVKNATGTRRLYLSSDNASGTRRNITFNLQTGALEQNDGDWSNVFITPLSNGWYRVGGTITDNGGSTLLVVGISDGLASSYPGDGTSGIYLWGAQLEAGAFPTSYIPTTTAAVTRSADVASITGSAFSGWYRQDEGTVFAEMDRNTAISNISTVVSINDNSTNNRLHNFRQDSASFLAVISATGGTLDAAIGLTLANTSNRNRIAAAQSLNNLAAVANGGTVASDTSVAMPTVNQMQIGNVISVSYFNGTIKRLTYWPTRLADTTLQSLTQ